MRGRLRCVYVFTGEEDLLKEEALSKLKKDCFPSGNESLLTFNYVSLHGTSTTSKRIIEEAQQLPFMNDRRLVVVKDAEDLIDETLLSYIRNPAESTCLALLMRKIDKRLSSYKILKANAEVVEFTRLREKDLTGWIQNYVNKCGKEISHNDAAYITNILENNLSGILQEVEKLITYTGARHTITAGDIELSVSENKIKDSFKLTDAIQQKDTSLAIGLVNTLLDQGKAVPEIIGLIRWMLTRLWQGKELIEKKKLNALPGELRIPPYLVNRFIHQAKRFSTPDLKKNLITLLGMEKLMRTYRIPQRLLLEFLVIQLAEPSLSGLNFFNS